MSKPPLIGSSSAGRISGNHSQEDVNAPGPSDPQRRTSTRLSEGNTGGPTIRRATTATPAERHNAAPRRNSVDGVHHEMRNAIRNGNFDAFVHYYSIGARFDARSSSALGLIRGRAPVHVATGAGVPVGFIRYMHEHGADMEQQMGTERQGGSTPFPRDNHTRGDRPAHQAIRHHNADVFRYLVQEAGINLDATNGSRQSVRQLLQTRLSVANRLPPAERAAVRAMASLREVGLLPVNTDLPRFGAWNPNEEVLASSLAAPVYEEARAAQNAVEQVPDSPPPSFDHNRSS